MSPLTNDKKIAAETSRSPHGVPQQESEAGSYEEEAVDARLRITVDLVGEAVYQFEEMLRRKKLTKSEAVRKALTILRLTLDDQYELILRDRFGKEPDQKIILV